MHCMRQLLTSESQRTLFYFLLTISDGKLTCILIQLHIIQFPCTQYSGLRSQCDTTQGSIGLYCLEILIAHLLDRLQPAPSNQPPSHSMPGTSTLPQTSSARCPPNPWFLLQIADLRRYRNSMSRNCFYIKYEYPSMHISCPTHRPPTFCNSHPAENI